MKPTGHPYDKMSKRQKRVHIKGKDDWQKRHRKLIAQDKNYLKRWREDHAD